MPVSVARAEPSPLWFTFRDVRLYLAAAVLVLLDVAVPWWLHQVPRAGPTFLPMHFFALFAGLLFGWRAGLLVGLFGPLASFVLSGLPPPAALPLVTAEIAAYGFISGLLRERFRLGALPALLIALVAGRAALALAVLALGTPPGPLPYVWAAVVQGYPGIIIQVLTLPLLIKVLSR